MKKLISSCLAAAFATALVHAAPADDVKAAAKKLADAPNYSWSRLTEVANSQFPATPVEGVTEKGGFTVTTANFGGNAFQTVSKGEQSVSQGQDGGWLTAEERRAQFAARGPGQGGGGRGGRGGFGFGGGGGGVNPAEDAASLAGKIKDAKVADGAIVGTLSAEDVAPLLAFGGRGGAGGGGQTPPAPKNASGSVKFWVKDGALAKYAVTVKGTITTPNGDDFEIERTTTTELKNVGTTKVTVPEDAKKKLGS